MQFRQRPQPISIVNLVPMVDIVFTIVIFYMVTSTFIVTPAISLKLPQSTTASPTEMSKLVVTVEGPDAIYLNRTHYTLAGLAKALAAISPAERRSIGSIVLEGDRSISYNLMIQVLDVLRTNDFKNVSLRLRPAEALPVGPSPSGGRG